MARLKINLDKAQASGAFDVVEQFWDYHKTGLTWGESGAQVAIDAAIDRYQVHIAAAFARVGITITPGEKITTARLLDVINEKTGLGIASLTPDAVRVAFDAQMSGRMSELLGVQVQSLDNLDAIKTALIDAAKNAVMSGRATKLITHGMIKKIRTLKTFRDEGVMSEIERQKVMNRSYQKTYRRTHREVWGDIGGARPADWSPDMYNHTRDN